MIWLIYGNSIFLSTEKLILLKEEFLKNTPNASSCVFDFDETGSFDELHSSLRAEGLFSPKKVFIIKNFIDSADKSEQDKLATYLEKTQISDDVLIIFWEKSEPRKNNKIFKLLTTKFKNEKLDNLSGGALVNWVKKEASNRNISFETSALSNFVSNMGEDLFQIRNEIEKLANFSNGVVTEEDVNVIIKSKVETNIFETIEALGFADKSKALKLFYEQLEQGSDPFYILSMYIYHFRNLLKVGSFYFDGITDKNIIAKEIKMHPFVVQKALAQLRGFSLEYLKQIYKELEKVDIDAKVGKMEVKRGIEKIIIGK